MVAIFFLYQSKTKTCQGTIQWQIMHSLGLITLVVSKKKDFIHFPIGSYAKNYGGSHIGFSISMKNSKLVQTVWWTFLQYHKKICPVVSEKNFEISANQNTLLDVAAMLNSEDWKVKSLQTMTDVKCLK